MEEYIKSLNTHNWKPEKGRTGILLIDLQEYFREIVRPALGNIMRTIDAAREMSIPLFFTQHGHEAGEDTGMLGLWWTDLIIKGSEDAGLLPELKIGTQDTVIHKNTYSAFYKTGLEKKLKEHKIEDLVIGGVMTNLCCETTARDAFVRDYRVFFLADGTATAGQDFHLSTLKNLSYGFAILMTCEQLIETVKRW